MFYSLGPHGGPGWLKEKTIEITAVAVFVMGMVKVAVVESARLGAMSLIALSMVWMVLSFFYSADESLQLINYVGSCFNSK